MITLEPCEGIQVDSDSNYSLGCETNTNECESSPCVHGQCTDIANGFVCTCDNGFTGETCVEELTCPITYDLLSDDSNMVDDQAFSASSEYNAYYASESRLSGRGWLTHENDHDLWIQVDFGETTIMTAIRTLGFGSVYLKQYKVTVSYDQLRWLNIEDNQGEEIVFEANINGRDIVRNPMHRPLIARCVRLTVIEYNVRPGLKWEIEGCPVPGGE